MLNLCLSNAKRTIAVQCDTPWAKHTNKSTFRKNTYALKCEHGLYQRYGPMWRGCSQRKAASVTHWRKNKESMSLCYLVIGKKKNQDSCQSSQEWACSEKLQKKKSPRATSQILQASWTSMTCLEGLPEEILYSLKITWQHSSGLKSWTNHKTLQRPLNKRDQSGDVGL